jgi:hypothetical protein
MEDDSLLELFVPRKTSTRYRARSLRAMRELVENGFRCRNCQAFVNIEPLFSGVRNRNHCPYCLWSRHLDLHQPGDRLAACKGRMQPIGLTVKRSLDKYGNEILGELMLIHRCQDCSSLSINRIAADDDPDRVLGIFQNTYLMDEVTQEELWQAGIRLLGEGEAQLVQTRLFGQQGCLAGCVV